MKKIEIERKFLINPDKIPYDLKNMYYGEMEQSYFNSTTRIRKTDFRNVNGVILACEHHLTIKSEGSKSRDEAEIHITASQYIQLLTNCSFKIEKNRYAINEGDKTYHLDQYKNDLEGFWTIEIEFTTLEKCDEYQPLEWFGEEVTEKREYSNFNLARDGIKKNKRIMNDKNKIPEPPKPPKPPLGRVYKEGGSRYHCNICNSTMTKTGMLNLFGERLCDNEECPNSKSRQR